MPRRLAVRCLVPAVLLLAVAACSSGGSDQKDPPPLVCSTAAGPLASTVTPDNGMDGIMFDVRAKKAFAVTGLSVQLPAGTTGLNVAIEHRSGSYAGHETEPMDWTPVGTTQLDAAESGPTLIPISFTIPVLAGETHAFYVTTDATATQGNPIVEYADATGDTTLAQDTNLELLEGVGVSYPFGDRGWTSQEVKKIFVGEVSYKLCN